MFWPESWENPVLSEFGKKKTKKSHFILNFKGFWQILATSSEIGISAMIDRNFDFTRCCQILPKSLKFEGKMGFLLFFTRFSQNLRKNPLYTDKSTILGFPEFPYNFQKIGPNH
jgi:hypothetical protein